MFKLYYCRIADSPDLFLEYMDRSNGEEYIVTTSKLSEAEFGTRTKMEWYTYNHPELEVCEIDAGADALSLFECSDDDVYQMDIPNVNEKVVGVAIAKFMEALASLNEIRPTFFCVCDDNDAMCRFADFSYDDQNDCICIELRYPRKRNILPAGDISKLNLG